MPSSLGPVALGHTYQAKPSCPCYNYYIRMPDYTRNRPKLQNQPPVVSYTFKLSSLVWQAQMAILALARTWFDKLRISGALVCGLF